MAHAFDVQGDYLEAVSEYERSILEKEGIPDAYLNLIWIYLLMQEFGWADKYGIPREMQSIGAARVSELVAELKLVFSDSAEAAFMELYSDFILTSYYLDNDDIRILLERFPNDPSPVPRFFLMLHEPEAYASSKESFLASLRKNPTAKNLGILAYF